MMIIIVISFPLPGRVQQRGGRGGRGRGGRGRRGGRHGWPDWGRGCVPRPAARRDTCLKHVRSLHGHCGGVESAGFYRFTCRFYEWSCILCPTYYYTSIFERRLTRVRALRGGAAMRLHFAWLEFWGVAMRRAGPSEASDSDLETVQRPEDGSLLGRTSSKTLCVVQTCAWNTEVLPRSSN